MSGSVSAQLDPETALEKLAMLTTSSVSPDGVVRLTMTGSRFAVKLHPIRLYSVTEHALGRDIATAFELLIRDRNEAEEAILRMAPAPAPPPDSARRAAFREQVREGIREIDVRVASVGRSVRVRWLGGVGLQVKFTNLQADHRSQLESEISSALQRICVGYHDAVQDVRTRIRASGSDQEGL